MPHYQLLARTCEGCALPFMAKVYRSGRGASRFCTLACFNAQSAPERRFWLNVNKLGSVPAHRMELGRCWEWTATTNRVGSVVGYGVLRVYGRKCVAHRFSWFLAHGQWPEPFCCHHCDNPRCVNPSHLFAGTHADNMADMAAKGRAFARKGSAGTNSKLTEDQVREIRRMVPKRSSYQSIADHFGVHKTTVYKIAKGQAWAHLDTSEGAAL